MARLTEEQVHQACSEIIERGEKPTSLVLLKELGFGSLSTITKYLKSYEATTNSDSDSDLPRVVELSDDLVKVGQDATKKIWLIASEIATAELEIQRTALDTAQKEAGDKVEEALAFSDAQTQKIDDLEKKIEDLLNANSELIENKVTNEKVAVELETNLASITEKNAVLIEHEEKISIENKALSYENAKYSGQIDSLEKEKKGNLEKIEALTLEIGGLVEAKDHALSSAKSLKSECDTAKKEIDDYRKNELENAKKQNDTYSCLVSRYDALRDELDKTIRERDALESDLVKFQKNV